MNETEEDKGEEDSNPLNDPCFNLIEWRSSTPATAWEKGYPCRELSPLSLLGPWMPFFHKAVVLVLDHDPVEDTRDSDTSGT
eukprot:CAMPEP_0170919338 /NCGR_PEP_ID=MMETSP0735-20130129/8526_1 /TAXON_ID=186038 /ORGANISM="Fragilariopsis kerguelensis, Strain L26-C5" /LENGTH=81 /DNA_ID=CAMNT_0011318003 /DNA_START=277 /DNA_END=519 /DNA_ORIENTATION=+